MIALICGIIVIILMIMGLASPDWLMAAGWKQGLFMHCIDVDAPQPLPFNMQEREGCYQSRDVGKKQNSRCSCISLMRVLTLISAYIRATTALCVITLLTDFVSTVLTFLGLRAKEHHTKYKYYRFAVIVMGLARKLHPSSGVGFF